MNALHANLMHDACLPAKKKREIENENNKISGTYTNTDIIHSLLASI